MLTIGESIRKARLDREYTCAQLAQESGVPAQNIYLWEWGKAYPSVLNLISVADALGITLDELVGRTVANNEQRTSE